MWRYNPTISSDEEQYLMHYGVKGMKWRKRKTGAHYANIGPETKAYAARVSAHNRATSKNTASSIQNKNIQRARQIEQKYGKGTMKSARAIRRDQQIRAAKGRAAQALRTAKYRGKQAARAGAVAARSKAGQAVSSLRAEINKRKKVSSAKRTAKSRIKKYKNTTQRYGRNQK